jgi:hypothetical protein
MNLFRKLAKKIKMKKTGAIFFPYYNKNIINKKRLT